MNLKIPKKDWTNLKKDYLSGKSSIKLSKKYKAHLKTVLNTLRKIGVRIRGPNENSRKYIIKENFFNTINSQKKAYFLGFLFADGCNHGKKVSLNLSKKDLKMLKILNLLVHPNGKPLYKGLPRISTVTRNGKKSIAKIKTNYSLIMENAHIAKILNSLGCTPRKTNTLKFPTIDQKITSHFIRGYFDGDGSLSISRNACGHPINTYISLISTIFFCERIQYILKKLKINCRILKKNYKAHNIVELRITEINSILKFLPWIYKNSTIHLERKYLKYKKLLKNRKYLSLPKIQRKCSLCNRKHYAKNLCTMHYQRMLKTKPL